MNPITKTFDNWLNAMRKSGLDFEHSRIKPNLPHTHRRRVALIGDPANFGMPTELLEYICHTEINYCNDQWKMLPDYSYKRVLSRPIVTMIFLWPETERN